MAVKSIGNMREVVEFLVNTPVAKGAGFEDSYSTLLTTRGQFIDRSGFRGLSFGAILNSSFLTLIVRFQSALESSLRSDTKIVISGVTYTFSTYRLVDQKKHLYEFEVQCQTN